MPFTIKSMRGSRVNILWNTNLNRTERKTEETIQLKLSQPYSCTHEIIFLSNYKVVKETIKDGSCTVKVDFNFCLSDAKAIECAEINSVSPSEVSDCRHRLCAAWIPVSFGDGNTMLSKTFPSGMWKSVPLVGNVKIVNTDQMTPNSELLRLWKTTPWEFDVYIEFGQDYSIGQRNILHQLTDMFVSQTNCDIQFSLPEDHHIGGHRCILAARSPVFSAMFQHNMSESITARVDITDVGPDIFKQLLHYIYSGYVKLAESTAHSLYVAADKYDVRDLAKECVEFLLSCIRKDNSIFLLTWAHLHSVNNIKEAALTFIAKHSKEIIPLEDWEKLMKNHPDLCLLVTRRMIK